MDGLMSFFSSMFGGGGGSGGGAMSMIQGAGAMFSTGLQAFSSLQQGKLTQKMYEMQAEQKRMEARQAETNALFESNAVRRKLIDDMASTSAFFSSRGFSVGSGSAQNAQIVSQRNAGEDYIAINQRRDIATTGIRGNASALVSEGVFARDAGRLKALEAIPTGLRAADSLFRGGMSGGIKGSSTRKSMLS